MRFALAVLIWALVCVATATAREWNLYSPCRGYGMSAQELGDYETDGRCDPDGLSAIHGQFNAPPLADVVGLRGKAVRVTVLDDYDRPVVMVEAIQERGLDPIAIARGRGDPPRRPPEIVEVEIGLEDWRLIASVARELARSPAVLADEYFVEPALDSDEDEVVICLHSWAVLIETMGFGPPRVIERNSCSGRRDAAFDLGWNMVRRAIDAFDGCSYLDRQFFRNDSVRLSFCLGLSGERDVAASATNAAQPFVDGAFVHERVRFILANEFTLALQDEPATAGAETAYGRWRAYVGAGDYSMWFETATGEGGGRATVNLLLVDETMSKENVVRFSEVSQQWRRDDEIWLLISMSVGPWQVLNLPDD